ncbi:MAG: hypothetical protein ACR2GR_01460 [Rhodothermales bacterium]
MKNAALLLAVLLTLAGCRSGSSEDVIRGPDKQADMSSDVVARVGGEAITTEAFRLDYEFGFGHLRHGSNPRQSYLRYAIAEKAMALEAERLGLDTAAAVVHALHMLEEELLVERVFEEAVLSRIDIREADVRAAIKQDAVRFRFRFLPALSEAAAWRLYDEIDARGYDAVLEEEQAALLEQGASLEELTSPMVDAEEIDPVILAAIQDVPVNMPSNPVAYGGLWYVFEVTDVERRPLAEADYEAKAPTYRKILYNQKAMEEGTAFVARTMEPLNVVTKRRGFEVLTDALWSWYREETPQRNLLHYIEGQGWEKPYAEQLQAHYDEVLVTFGEETWTIRTFLEHFTPGRYVLRADDERQFKARLADVVGLVVRDAVFLRRAHEEGLDQDPVYQRTLAQWKAKWLFEELKKRPFVQYRLATYADSLVDATNVVINEAVLDTLTLSTPEDARLTVQLLKSNSNKRPFPTVDPGWRAVFSPSGAAPPPDSSAVSHQAGPGSAPDLERATSD